MIDAVGNERMDQPVVGTYERRTGTKERIKHKRLEGAFEQKQAEQKEREEKEEKRQERKKKRFSEEAKRRGTKKNATRNVFSKIRGRLPLQTGKRQSNKRARQPNC